MADEYAFAQALDAYLTNPGSREQILVAFCNNDACVDYGAPVMVLANVEFGHAYWHPDGCPSCGKPLSDEEPEPLEEVRDAAS